ncbi:MAG TPA: PspC domain-containing protein [Flavobacterium sp.]|jgi:phage shock protein PspC (stress-responsive transcriptional regulator)
MNKTVNINLGGMFFHIDEDAYQKLTRYFDAIKRSLTNSTGQDEIIKDIEMRVAELIAEKHTNDKQVVNLREVDEVIAVMGQPEDYRIEDDSAAPGANEYTAYEGRRKSRKLYRDTEKGMLGGVSTGLSHYFGIDAIWLRIMFLLFVFFGFGTGIIAYIILWVVTPAAVTTAEKLEMTGEPVTISNIEKKVREEFDNVSQKFRGANYDKMGNQVKTGAERVAGNVGDALLTIFRIFAKILGAILVVFAAGWLIFMLIGLFTLGSTSFVDVPWQNYIDAVNYTNIPLWIIGLLSFCAIGIPLFFLFLLGLKLLVNNLKSIGNIAKYALLAVWLISVGILITLGIRQATEIAFDGKVMEKQAIQIQPTDTLEVKFRFNDYYSKSFEYGEEFLFTQDESDKEIIYSNNVNLHFMRTDEKVPYVQVERTAEGKSLAEAKKRAENIRYSYKIEGNQLILDNYLVTDIANKYRNQEVEIYLYVPQNQIIKTNNSIERYDVYDDDFTVPNGYDNKVYRAEGSEFKCLNCTAEELSETDGINENEIHISSDSTSASVTIDENGVRIKEGNGDAVNKEVTGLKINEDGIIIKTK